MKVILWTCAPKIIPFTSMGGLVEGLACTDPGTRTHQYTEKFKEKLKISKRQVFNVHH